jgi:plasmid stabilization system protein ParE
MSDYTLAPKVPADLAEIWRHIAEDNPDAADRVLDAISAAFIKRCFAGLAGVQLSDYLPLQGRTPGNRARPQRLP